MGSISGWKPSSRGTRLNSSLDYLSACIRTIRLRAGISDCVALSVEAGNKHRAIVLIAPGLITGKDRTLTTLRSHIPETFTEATVTKLGGTSKELD
jgi:hypothetical protein